MSNGPGEKKRIHTHCMAEKSHFSHWLKNASNSLNTFIIPGGNALASVRGRGISTLLRGVGLSKYIILEISKFCYVKYPKLLGQISKYNSQFS